MNDQFQNQQPQINIKIEDLTDIECDECQGKYFRPVAMMKRLSPLVSPPAKNK